MEIKYVDVEGDGKSGTERKQCELSRHAAHNVSPDERSSLLLLDLETAASGNFGQDTMLGDPHDDWPKWVTDVILHSNTWKARLAKAKCEDWWAILLTLVLRI